MAHVGRVREGVSRLVRRSSLRRERPKWRMIGGGAAFSSSNSNSNSDISSSHQNYSILPCPLPENSLWINDAKVINVGTLADKLRRNTRAYTHSHPNVKLMGILAENGPFRHDAETYSSSIAATCFADGIQYELMRCPGNTPEDVEAVIRMANERDDVDGILIFYPIFGDQPQSTRGPYINRLTGVYYKSFDDYLRDVVDPAFDVEGLNGAYSSRLALRKGKQSTTTQKDDNNSYDLYWDINDPDESNRIVPCTAQSVQHILDHYHSTNWEGQIVSIINRSEIFGRPLASMLASKGALVNSIDLDSVIQFRPGGRSRKVSSNTSMETHLKASNVIVTGVPSPDFAIPSDCVGEGTTVVNVSEYPNVCRETLLQQPNIQYIPHVGKVTVAVLEQNLIRLHRAAAERRRLSH